MTTVFFYVFVFSSWGLGLLSWMVALSDFMTRRDLESKEKFLEITQKKALFNRFNDISGIQIPSLTQSEKTKRAPWGRVGEAEESPELIPEKIKELMKSSPNHPEVEEIDGTDQILGVKFEARDYPPVFGDGDGEDDE
jgi:hypothetical protein